MPQNAEAAAFLARVAELPTGPGVLLDEVLKLSLEDEAELRKLFAQDKKNPRLADRYVGLVDVFDASKDIRTTRARVVGSDEDLNAKYIMPLSAERRRTEGSPAMVDSLDDFKKYWAVFTESCLSQLTDWNNVVAAGGSVQACLAPVPESAQVSKRSLRKHFHNRAFPTSDVDLFLYGLTPEQAEVKINQIYEAVRDSVPWDVTCIRTKHTVSIHSQYPYRAVQIVLRLYQSPAEILAGFDVDAPCCAYDGSRVYANPRAIVAMMRQCNTVDVTRRSPSYEARLTKYSRRGFEVFVPQLNRGDIDPTIYERSIIRIQGLARLLVLEHLASVKEREGYLESRRSIRGRPGAFVWLRHLRGTQYKGDLKTGSDLGLEMNDYDVGSLHIPYGPGWDARRIEKLVYQTDFAMNSLYNPKNKGRTLHRHVAFFGTMPECLADCCEHCPVPQNDKEREQQVEEDKTYIRGRVRFIVEDPGRQSLSGSFNPIDDGEWSAQAYIGVTEKFFHAIAAHDRDAVTAAINSGIDVNRRDYVGRTPLQVAVLSEATEIACDLIDADARMTARLVDGRTALHLAAQLNLPTVARKMLERSAVNDREAKAAAERKVEEKAKDITEKEDKMDVDDIDVEPADKHEDEDTRNSSEDDWSSDDDEPNEKVKEQEKDDADQNADVIPEYTEDEPDVFQIDAPDWDYTLSALDYGVASGSVEVVELLLANGANPKLDTTSERSRQARRDHPLILATTTEDEDKASQIAEKLISAGAVVSEADDNLFTIFHRSIYSGRPSLVSTFLKVDPNAKVVLDVPWMDDYDAVVFPIVSAVKLGSYSMLAVLLAHGAKLQITHDDFQRARDMKLKSGRKTYNRAPEKFLSSTFMPVEVALTNFDDVVTLLAALGADLNLPTKESLRSSRKDRYTLLDFAHMVSNQIKEAKPGPQSPKRLSSPETTPETTPVRGNAALPPGAEAVSPRQTEEPAWKTECKILVDRLNNPKKQDEPTPEPDEKEEQADPIPDEDEERFDYIEAYYGEMVEVLESHEAKPGAEIWEGLAESDEARHDALKSSMSISIPTSIRHRTSYRIWESRKPTKPQPFLFYRHGLGSRAEFDKQYEELYSACWDGDNTKIRRLCLPEPGQKSRGPPLQISAHWGDSSDHGFTPLFVALYRRHWETAKLIVAIAAAQYKPKEAEEKKYSTWDPYYKLDDEFVEDDDDVDMDSEDSEAGEIDLIDIAKIPTEVHTNTAPTYMLESSQNPYSWKDGGFNRDSLLDKTIWDDDLDAFVRILDLYNVLPGEPEPDSLIDSLIWRDRPAMLDEYIRRTGQGVALKNKRPAQDESSQESEADPDVDLKSYLGLNVHGRKRKDLASQHDPHAETKSTNSDKLPLLWSAAKRGAVRIVRYLAGDQPLAAYKHYASTHSDYRAKVIRQVTDLDAVLSEKLGWATTKLNESVTLAAIVGHQLEMLETLCALPGKKLEATLHLKHRTKGFNSILAAVYYAEDNKIFDYLLSKGVSPLETDHKGWNIFHVFCACKSEASVKLLKHALEHLPRETTERMFRQQTKEDKRTPLHLAVNAARLDIVRLFIESGVAQYLIRESEGYTPLQLAIKHKRPQIAKLLAEAGPPEALTLEDGVGNTPLEVATRQAFREKLNVVRDSKFERPSRLEIAYKANPFNLEAKEAELPRFRATLNALLREGLLKRDTNLTNELLAFADRLEATISREKPRAEERRRHEEERSKKSFSYRFSSYLNDDAERDKGGTASEVLEVIRDALAARPTLRRLVHLSDVHDSVTRSLERLSRKQQEDAREFEEAEDDGLLEEADAPESALISNDWNLRASPPIERPSGSYSYFGLYGI